MTPQEHREWAVNRALALYDAGDSAQAIMSFISDSDKSPETEWLVDHPLTLFILTDGAARGREKFREAMNGFSIKMGA